MVDLSLRNRYARERGVKAEMAGWAKVLVAGIGLGVAMGAGAQMAAARGALVETLAGSDLPTFAAGAGNATLAADTQKNGAPQPPKTMHSFDLSSLDKTADPCTNFYQYTCGNWKKHNPIPPDEPSWGSFGILDQRNQYLLYKELKTAAADPKSPLEKQYGDYFKSCMDTSAINTQGAKPVQPSLDAIAALKDKHGIGALLGDTRYDVGGFVNFGPEPDQKDSSHWIAGVQQGGLTLPDRDYYLSDDPHMKEVREKYHDYIVQLMKLAGETPTQAETTAQDVLRIETAMAKASMPREEQRDPDNIYHPMPVTQLEQLAPVFDWKQYFAAQKAPAFARIDVAEPDFFKAMNGLIQTEPLEALKQYMKFQTVNGVAQRLSMPFDEAHFDFFGKVLNGQAEEEARWKRCTASTDGALGEAVGQGWVKQNFPPQAKQDMKQLVANLETAMHADIGDVSWMSEPTKKEAELKLSQFRDKIGYPDKWRSYAGVAVSPSDWYGDAHRAGIFNNTYYLDKIGGPVDESEWGMTPPTVNAYYNPSQNDINFPAGILQPPFYQFGMDPGVNYGSIGAVIGHEMTHGFDDEGSRFDGKGNKRDWFTADDRKKFDERTDCEVKEYGGFAPLPGKTLNGKLTLGENTADNGGIRIAYQALQKVLAAEPAAQRDKKIDGYTEDQRFFIAFGQIWCENMAPAMQLQMLKVDPHSPGEFRTNGVVQNFPEFGKAFGCHEGQPMMPVHSCRVW
jgi:putative endopeptidase